MKHEYLEPTVDVIRFQTEDILTTSGRPGIDDRETRPGSGIELPDMDL